jgi:diguanylate cyclase (GGDEF)-like protein
MYRQSAMSVITLRKYLNGTEESQGYRRVIDRLLRGYAGAAVAVDEKDYTAFRQDMQRIVGEAGDGCPLEQLLVTAGAAVQATEAYNTRTKRLLGEQTAELQDMIAMLTQSIQTIAGGSEKSIAALADVRQGLESAAAVTDIHTMKARLGECLRVVCQEASRQKQESEEAIRELQGHIERAQKVGFVSADDSATGLPKRKAAEEAIQQSLMVKGRKYVVVAVMDRLPAINARFGHDVGDQVLRALRDRIQSALGESDMLFRWNGPTIVAVLWREAGLEQTRAQLKHMLEAQFDKEFDIGGRSVLIPISAAWSVVGMIPPAANLFHHVDRFVASQTPRYSC